MAIKNLNKDNILVKVDQNNLISIDPNTIIEGDYIIGREVNQENLVMYVNLEADLIPRTILATSPSGDTLTTIASGVFNLLNNTKGRDLDTTWTDSYYDVKKLSTQQQNSKTTENIFYQSDETGQSFGIKEIEISINASFVPQINITFIDVRGKTLFDSPKNSPYNAFFHLPWPIFYLTVKGYYGKAIKYRLHMIEFRSRYDDSNGNFEISTSFVGSTYAYISDIPLSGVLNAPYMFSREHEVEPQYNEKKGIYEKRISKTTKGYQLLTAVYNEMKQKNLIPQDFPVKTVRELGIVADSLDQILEATIFNQVVDAKVLKAISDYGTTLNTFQQSIQGWANNYLSSDTREYGTIKYYRFKNPKSINDDEHLLGVNVTGTLEKILNTYTTQLNTSLNIILKAEKKAGFKTNLLSKRINGISGYYVTRTINASLGQEYLVAFDELSNDIHELAKTFKEQKDNVENIVEQKMNDVIKDKSSLGFEPTIRNLFAVLLANAEVFIRLLKETHIKAFDIGNERKKLIANYNDETKGEPIYPWPQIRKRLPGKNKYEVVYPGEKDMRNELKSNNAVLWPEVDFVEDYYKTAAYETDPLSTKEGGKGKIVYVFNSNNDVAKNTPISNFYSPERVTPYTNVSPALFLIEIYERAKKITLLDSFSQKTLRELANDEFDTIKNSIAEEVVLTDILKTKIKTYSDLVNLIKQFATLDSLEYFNDGLPITSYLNDSLPTYYLDSYDVNIDKSPYNNQKYTQLSENLNNYIAEDYRKNIYPFNSDTYLLYIGVKKDNLNFTGSNVFSTDTANSLISTPISKLKNSSMWLKDGYNHIFDQNLSVNNNNTNILNTPYFHNQLYSDFIKTNTYGKYSGSAYLLLNSLALKDLDEYVVTGKTSVRMSSMFKEIGATHFVPYLLLLKWGSIYHRYKNYLVNGVDILNGFLNSSNITQPIDGNLFFSDNDNSNFSNFTFNYQGSEIFLKYSDFKDIGIHPFYDAIFHEIINGYAHFDVTSGSTSYGQGVYDGTILTTSRFGSSTNLNYWTTLVDNSKFDSTDIRYTIIPCDGYNKFIDKNSPSLLNTDGFNKIEQDNFRIIWTDEYIPGIFSGVTFPTYDEYNKDLLDQYSLGSSYKKFIDLIGTFSPEILSGFEDIFLEFSSQYLNVENAQNRFSNVSIDKFQLLLKEIVSIDKNVITNQYTQPIEFFEKVKNMQTNTLNDISFIALQDNLIKFTMGNPKELNSYVLEGFSGFLKTSTLSFSSYDPTQLNSNNQSYLDLYLGEFPDSGTTNYYIEFFQTNDIQLNENNILQLRPLILIYAGYRKNGGIASRIDFNNYLISQVINRTLDKNGYSGSNNRFGYFLTQLIGLFSSLKKEDVSIETIKFSDDYNESSLKTELYNSFKAFNDKWTSGNSIGQKLLLEEFLFLDKANADIGDVAYLNLHKFKELNDPENINISLYSAIASLISETGFDMRPLPAYVNFYGYQSSSAFKATPSSTIADNLFGTFLDVDYVDSEPKIVIQLVGDSSKHLDNPESVFDDDSFDISDPHDNPLLITAPKAFESKMLEKSNKVVAFEVNFGDQNQNIFNGLTLDQKTLKNTSESYYVLERLGGAETGANTQNIDVSLYDYYRLASYSCEVKCLGNVMIQPTMFFYLKNIPLFKGTYWITDVNHKIFGNTISTTFTGSRLPRTSLPDPKDSFVANYRDLFEKILNKAIAYVNTVDMTPTNELILNTDQGAYAIYAGLKKPSRFERFVNEAGITKYGIAYNGRYGDEYIQKIEYLKNVSTNVGKYWLRAIVVGMGDDPYIIPDNRDMSVLGDFYFNNINTEYLKWGTVKQYTNTFNFYSTHFDFTHNADVAGLQTASTVFLNPNNDKTITIQHSYNLNPTSGAITYEGPINNGPYIDYYGIGMSKKLMKQLDLQKGDVVYFNII